MRYLMVVLLFVISCATTRPEIVFELPPQEIIHTVAVEINKRSCYEMRKRAASWTSSPSWKKTIGQALGDCL